MLDERREAKIGLEELMHENAEVRMKTGLSEDGIKLKELRLYLQQFFLKLWFPSYVAVAVLFFSFSGCCLWCSIEREREKEFSP